MALPADYISGTITLTNGSPDFTGTGTGWQAADFREGDILLGVEDHAGQVYVIEAITGNAAGTLTQDWAGTSGTYTYRMRYEWDSSRVSAQARAMVELLGNGNLESIASLTGPGVVVLEGPHSAGIRPFADFINGVAYNVQVDTLADRAAYDGQTAGFAVLVADVGDGRSAVYSKASNTSGDWTDPAYITGPVGEPGPYTEITVGPTTTLPPGSPATVTPVVVDPDTIRLDFALPRGMDGMGTVAGIDQGTGIAVDVSDPTRPVVSLDATFSDLNDVDFTTNPPEDGDVPVWDAVQGKFVPGAGGGSGSGLQVIKEFTISGSWTPTDPTNLKGILVEVQAAGGGGGGSGANNATGGGGGAGGNSEKFIPAEDLGASEAVVVGAAGSGGATGANNGSAGGASSFGAFLSATGGDGGQHATGSSMPNNGGTGTGGDINLTGGSGVPRLNGGAISSTPGGNAPKGLGFGGGSLPATVNANGSNAAGFGSGGGGGLRVTASVAGGNGAPGVVIVREFY